MRVISIPCLSDNYAYLLHDEGAREAAVVDPSEAAPILAELDRHGLSLTAILNTHHHYDHVGGNEGLLARFPGVPVYGHGSDREKQRIPGQTHGLADGEELRVLPARHRALALHIPGHTLGAVAYYFPADGMVFTGDTLFAAGCGRLFEGTPPMMHASLAKLAALPPETQVYCGHEYTVRNLEFAASVEPGNQAVAARRDRVAALRTLGRPSVPSMMAEELATNPFLRTAEPEVRVAAVQKEPTLPPDAPGDDILGALRRWKDRF